jgi:hypothetical protein
MTGSVRDVRGRCGTLCGAETRMGQGLCGVCGTRLYTGAHEQRSAARLHEAHRARGQVPHAPHVPHNAGGARVSAVRGPVRGLGVPAQACSRARANSLFRVSREVGGGGLE